MWTALPCRAEDEAETDYLDFLDVLPPVSLSGSLSYSVTQSRSPRGDSTLNQGTNFTVDPNTYIYEPWLATVTSTINVSMNSQGSQSIASGQSLATTDTVTGSVMINVLPQSEYPVDLFYSSFDNTAQMDDSVNNSSGQTMRISAQQKPWEDLSLRTILQVDQTVDSSGAGAVSSQIQVDGDKRFDEDYMRAGLDHRISQYTGGGLGVATANISSGTLRYRSRPFDTVTSDSMTTVRFSSTADQEAMEDAAVMQGVTTSMWRPSFAEDVIVHGAWRSFQDQVRTRRRIKTGGYDIEDRSSRASIGNLTTSYPLAPRLLANLGLNGGFDGRTRKTTRVGGTSGSRGETSDVMSFSAGGNGAINYTSESNDWQGFTWIWNVGGGGSMSVATAGASHSEETHVGHSLSRPLEFFYGPPITVSLSENLGFNFGTSGMTIPLNHSMGLGQSSRDGKTWDMWSFTFSDSRSFGVGAATYQLANIQLTKGYDPDRFSSWSAGLTYQLSRQTSETEVGTMRDTMGGSISYRMRDIFGVDNLGFSSDLSFNPPSLMSVSSQRSRDFSSSSATATKQPSALGSQRWNNRLDYVIGMVRANLIARINNGGDGMGQTILFQVSRRF
ncbi:MAG: hypothetical protein H7840_06860 [Alphaproteobacteria bacterium]